MIVGELTKSVGDQIVISPTLQTEAEVRSAQTERSSHQNIVCPLCPGRFERSLPQLHHMREPRLRPVLGAQLIHIITVNHYNNPMLQYTQTHEMFPLL